MVRFSLAVDCGIVEKEDKEGREEDKEGREEDKE